MGISTSLDGASGCIQRRAAANWANRDGLGVAGPPKARFGLAAAMRMARMESALDGRAMSAGLEAANGRADGRWPTAQHAPLASSGLRFLRSSPEPSGGEGTERDSVELATGSMPIVE